MSIDAEKTVTYWIDSANYDLEIGKTLLRSKKYPYALFFAHLAIEKLLKANVVKTTGAHAPYTHSLVMLVQKTNLEVTEAMMDQLAEYMEFHTEARYPDVKMDFYRKCTKEFARAKFSEMKKVCKWLLKKSVE